MKRVLITGAAGFVGANLVRRLLARGDETHVVVRPATSMWRLREVSSRLRVHIADLCDQEAIHNIVDAIRPEWVFHLAAHGGRERQDNPDQIVQDNVVGTIGLLDACVRTGVESFVNTGSSSEYGFKDHPPAESELLEPNSAYAASKASATMFCTMMGKQRGAPIVTLRLYSAYGPFEEPDRLIPSLIVAGVDGRLPPLVSPDTARDFVYIDDVTEAYILAATAGSDPGSIFNIGTGRQTTLGQIVDVVRSLMAIASEPVWNSMPGRRWDTDVWVCDNRLAREQLHWNPRTGLDEGLAATIDWLRSHPELIEHYRSPWPLPDK